MFPLFIGVNNTIFLFFRFTNKTSSGFCIKWLRRRNSTLDCCCGEPLPRQRERSDCTAVKVITFFHCHLCNLLNVPCWELTLPYIAVPLHTGHLVKRNQPLPVCYLFCLNIFLNLCLVLQKSSDTIKLHSLFVVILKQPGRCRASLALQWGEWL